MTIKKTNIDIWITPDEGGKQFQNELEVEQLLSEIVELIKAKGYYMKPKVCSPNPSLSIFKG